MVGWTIVLTAIILTSVVVVFMGRQRKAGHIAYWQQQRAVEERKREAASWLFDSFPLLANHGRTYGAMTR